MPYEYLWADMHANPHHHQIGQLEQWYRHARQVMDFWLSPTILLPSRRTPTGAELEDLIPEADLRADWDAVLAWPPRRGGRLAAVPRLRVAGQRQRRRP